MATKIVCTRVCDRCGKPFPGYAIKVGEAEPPLAGVSFKMVKSNRDTTSPETIVNLEDVCESCTAVVESLVKRIRLDEPEKAAVKKPDAPASSVGVQTITVAPLSPETAPAPSAPAVNPAALAAAAVKVAKAPAAPVVMPVAAPIPSDPSAAQEREPGDESEEQDAAEVAAAPVAAAPAAPEAPAAAPAAPEAPVAAAPATGTNGAKKGDKKATPKATPNDYPF